MIWDMKTEAGKRAIRRLLETSDVFIHNIRPDAIDRLGLGYEPVKKYGPTLSMFTARASDSMAPMPGCKPMTT